MTRTRNELQSPGFRRILSLGASLVLGSIFLLAGVLKAPAPGSFSDQILRLFDADPESWLGPVLARGVIAGEIALGLFLLFRVRPRLQFGIAFALLLSFAAVILRAQAVGERDCGCFGEQLKRSPEQALLEDAMLLIAAGVGLAVTPSRRSDSSRSGGRGRSLTALTLAAFSLAGAPLFGPPRGTELFREGRYIGFLGGSPVESGEANPSSIDLRREELLLVLLPVPLPRASKDDALRQELLDLAENPVLPPAAILVPGKIGDPSPSAFSLRIEDSPFGLPTHAFDPQDLDGLTENGVRTLLLFQGTVEKTWPGIPSGSDLECQDLDALGSGPGGDFLDDENFDPNAEFFDPNDEPSGAEDEALESELESDDSNS